MNVSHYNIPSLAFHLSARKQNSNTETQLTQTEKKLHKILSKANSKTFIGFSIGERLRSGSLGSFREMIKELNEQRIVAEKELVRAIGKEAVDLIATIYK